jgi:hypothetical protein
LESTLFILKTCPYHLFQLFVNFSSKICSLNSHHFFFSCSHLVLPSTFPKNLMSPAVCLLSEFLYNEKYSHADTDCMK